jgi:glycosyltransferase involved in cell wall biosynthesis
MESPRVTIVVPNWNTGPLLRLCLASALRFTAPPVALVVVDNASTDASRRTAEAAQARGLIRLVTREDAKNEGAADHGAALDLGLSVVDTPYLFTLDSDAWARRAGWLERWLAALDATPGAAHAGATKFPGSAAQRAWAWARGRQPGPEARYIRPCHALYRVALLKGLSFAPRRAPDGRAMTVGEGLHEDLVARGHPPAFMPHAEVEAHVGHLRHSTFVLNPERFPTLRARARRRGERAIGELCSGAEARAILEGSVIP